MKKAFLCSLCHNGIVGGTLYLDEKSVTYHTNKLTVDKAYKTLVLAHEEIVELTWKWIVFPIATFHMKNGQKYNVLIFSKRRFEKWYQAYRAYEDNE